jgi:hypothetical protein
LDNELNLSNEYNLDNLPDSTNKPTRRTKQSRAMNRNLVISWERQLSHPKNPSPIEHPISLGQSTRNIYSTSFRKLNQTKMSHELGQRYRIELLLGLGQQYQIRVPLGLVHRSATLIQRTNLYPIKLPLQLRQ